ALDVDLDSPADRARVERDVRRPDVRVERRRGRAGADGAELARSVEERVALARHTRPRALDADELALRILLHALERRASDPVALVGMERDAEREPGLDRIVLRVDFVAVQ